MIRVYPYVSSQARYGNLAASVLYPKHRGRRRRARVRAQGRGSMPAVDLGTSTAGTATFSALGFTKIPEAPLPTRGRSSTPRAT